MTNHKKYVALTIIFVWLECFAWIPVMAFNSFLAITTVIVFGALALYTNHKAANS